MEARMKANPNRFWIIVILLGWIFDFLFWGTSLGINFAIFVALCLVTGIVLLRTDGLRPGRGSALLLLPIAFLAAMTLIRLEPLTVFLSIAMVLFLMGVFALAYRSGDWLRYSLLDYAFGYLRLFGSVMARPLGFAAENRREQPSGSAKRRNPIWPVLRGIVIALPVTAIFASLLSSADPVFAERFQDFIDLFRIDNLPEYIFRLVYILILAYALAGIFLHAAQKSDEKVEEKTWGSPFLGFPEATIVLGSVIVLFVAFVVIQFQYFFGGEVNIGLEDYTYSEYARQGFAELVTVAFFSLLLLLGLGAITRRETESQRRTFSLLGVGLVGLVIVMLVAAFQRLVLYEAAYGFSRLRTYTHVFMIWLGVLLVAVVVLEVLHRERLVGLAMILAALGFVVSLSLLNVDAFIVRQNVQRELNGGGETSAQQSRVDLDAQYFLALSDDAIPALVDTFQSESLPVSVKEKIGAALACKAYRREPVTDLPWQSFHFSHLNADLALREIGKELETYQVDTDERSVIVETPEGEEFPCYQYYYD
jgi:hypothetical protein